ncbi:hypothetical protein [Streptomyces sp. NPDC060022]|uniref:hypothetical protein n=1 Tax=Streptomyces sp. NPDC060022 TaxID=3347039 RepID=UPI0036857D6D
MTRYYRDEQVTLLLGDALDQMRTLPDRSVDCIVTSPPYYGLRCEQRRTASALERERLALGPADGQQKTGLLAELHTNLAPIPHKPALAEETSSVGPRCGNNPNMKLSPGDQQAVSKFKAYLKRRADGELPEATS